MSRSSVSPIQTAMAKEIAETAKAAAAIVASRRLMGDLSGQTASEAGFSRW